MTSKELCIYGECDGSGFISSYNNDFGVDICKPCRCREQKIMQRKLEFANIPSEFESLTIKSYDTEIYQADESRNLARNIKKAVIQYVNRFDEMKEKGKGLYFYGETKGSGKTRLAVSIGNALILHKKTDVRFITTLNLLEEIKNTWDNRNPNVPTQSELLSDIKRIDVLILDDFGTEKSSPWVNEMFYNILNDRMTAAKITIFTSNCRIEDLQHDSRIVNRLPKMAIPIKFPEESVRTAISRSENEEILRQLMEG